MCKIQVRNLIHQLTGILSFFLIDALIYRIKPRVMQYTQITCCDRCLSASIYKLAIDILATDAFPILAKTGDQYQNVRYPDMKNISAIHFRQYAFSCATLQNLSQMVTNAKPSGNPGNNLDRSTGNHAVEKRLYLICPDYVDVNIP